MSTPSDSNQICVSVVMPARNEGRFIEAAITSLQSQQTPDFHLEILVVDGMSDDDTASKVTALAAADHRVKLLRNPARHTPAALNIGLRAARGEYVCIMGAHASYDPDYISVCLRELVLHQAVGCSGKLVAVPADANLQARLVAWAAANPFASSSRSVRTQPEGYVDTAPFPVMRKQALLEAGGYNENLVRNQDNDMNQRLRALGYRLYVTHKTQCRYYTRPTIKSFLKYAFVTGLWNALSLKENPASLGLRHFAPLALIAALLVLSGFVLAGGATPHLHSGIPALVLGLILATHLLIGAVAGTNVWLREGTLAGLWLAPLILGFHCAYGLGMLRGLAFPFRAHEAIRAHAVPESSNDAA